MNPKYRGDGKDFFKRGFLGLVRTLDLIRGPQVLPMFTGEFQALDVRAYTSLLGINKQDLVSERRLYPKQGRQAYFDVALAEAELGQDLFLDPCRGLISQLRGETSDREVITMEEVSRLLPAGQTQRILMIYDESLDMSDRGRATSKKLDALQTAPYHLAAFAYFNSSPNHPNIVCVANQAGRERLAAFRAALERHGVPSARLMVCEA